MWGLVLGVGWEFPVQPTWREKVQSALSCPSSIHGVHSGARGGLQAHDKSGRWNLCSKTMDYSGVMAWLSLTPGSDNLRSPPGNTVIAHFCSDRGHRRYDLGIYFLPLPIKCITVYLYF